MRPKISIIIPVYNAAPYLSACLDSILSQLYTNYEIILINDGSKDNSGRICDEYAHKDARLRVIHKENGGVSAARNLGIKEAKGEWLYFSDADDIVLPHALEVLAGATIHDVELVNAGYIAVDDNGTELRKVPYHQACIISKDEMVKRLIYSAEYNYQGNLWCKLFRTDIVKELGIQFDPKIYFNEDRLFIMKYVCRSLGRVWFSTTPVYQYVERDNSAMGSLKRGFNPRFVTDLDASLLMLDEVVQAGCSQKNIKAWKNASYVSYTWIISSMKKFNYDDKRTKLDLKHRLINSIGCIQYLYFNLRMRAVNIKLKIIK